MAKSSGAKCVSSTSWWHPTPKFLMISPVVSYSCWTTLLPPLLCNRLSNGPQFMLDLIHPEVFFPPFALQLSSCLLHYFLFSRKTRGWFSSARKKVAGGQIASTNWDVSVSTAQADLLDEVKSSVNKVRNYLGPVLWTVWLPGWLAGRQQEREFPVVCSSAPGQDGLYQFVGEACW